MFSPKSASLYAAVILACFAPSPLAGPSKTVDPETVLDVGNEPPVAIIAFNPTVTCQGSVTAVVLDGSASYDPEGEPITFDWAACPGTVLSDPHAPITTAYLDTSSSCDLTCGIRLFVEDPDGFRGFARTFLHVESEEGCVLPTTNCSNFNGTAIPTGRFIWFNSVLKPSNLGAGLVDVLISGAHIDFSANGHSFSLPVPDAHITFSPAASSASTSFDPIAGRWETIVPAGFTQNVFMTGLAYAVPENLPGGINPVCFAATISTNTAGAKFQWKWGAAVYTQFSTDHGALGVKPIDGNSANPYANSDHAGTPENFKGFVTGGARGGGGSNFTGSYSGTVSAACP
jgi:hypothetical protein